MNDSTTALKALFDRLNELPVEWRNHARGDGSDPYQEGFDYCADALEEVLENLTTAFDKWSRDLAGEPPAPKHSFIKCLHCGLKSYHPKDREERYCAQCHIFHDSLDEKLTFELG